MPSQARQDFDNSMLEIYRIYSRLDKELVAWKDHLASTRGPKPYQAQVDKRPRTVRRLSVVCRRLAALDVRGAVIAKRDAPKGWGVPLTIEEAVREYRREYGRMPQISVETIASWLDRVLDGLEQPLEVDEVVALRWEDRITHRIKVLRDIALNVHRSLEANAAMDLGLVEKVHDCKVHELKFWMGKVGIKVSRQSSPLEYFSRTRPVKHLHEGWPSLISTRDNERCRDEPAPSKCVVAKPVAPTRKQFRITNYFKPIGRQPFRTSKVSKTNLMKKEIGLRGSDSTDMDWDANMEVEDATRAPELTQTKITDFFEDATEPSD